MVCSVRSTLVLEVLSYFLILLRQLTDSKKCTSKICALSPVRFLHCLINLTVL